MTTEAHFGTPFEFTSALPAPHVTEPHTIWRAKSGTPSPTESFVGDAQLAELQAITSTQSATPSLSRSSRPVAQVAAPQTIRSTVSGMMSGPASQAANSLVAEHEPAATTEAEDGVAGTTTPRRASATPAKPSE